jgi:hypothetical protein
MHAAGYQRRNRRERTNERTGESFTLRLEAIRGKEVPNEPKSSDFRPDLGMLIWKRRDNPFSFVPQSRKS